MFYLTFCLEINSTVDVIHVVHPVPRVAQHSVLLLADDLVADEIGFALDSFVKFLRFVGNSPVDELLQPCHDVLENDDEGESRGEDFPVVSWTFVWMFVVGRVSELWITTNFEFGRFWLRLLLEIIHVEVCESEFKIINVFEIA